VIVLGRRAPAPSAPRRRAGVLLSALCIVASACEAPALPGGGPELQLEDASVRLPRGATVHTVELGAAARGFQPQQVAARPGDALRFTVMDAMLHDIAFDAPALPPDARTFLETTGQLRSPPLVVRGATWVVSLEDAPPGRYPFLCTTHQERGEVTIGS
jgi:plastocyanin